MTTTGNQKKYLQYVANDPLQLNSDVIRVFKTTFDIKESPDLMEVVKGEVDFYVHCVVKLGLKLGLWEKVGHAQPVGKVDVLFRDTNDIAAEPGREPTKVSHNWYVWHINDKSFTPVGRLTGKAREAEIGVVIPAQSVVHRIKTGKYDFTYPD